MKRHALRGTAALLLLLILVAPVGAAETPPPPAPPATPPTATPFPGVVGTWISPQVTQAGILMVLQFAPDGAVRASLRSRAAVQYQFLSSEGDSYHLAFSSGDDTVEQTVDVTGDEMVLHQPNQEAARTLVRVPNSPVGDPPFVGRWVSGEQGSPEIVLLEYTADGHLLFDLPVRTLLGTYTVEGEQILIAWSSKGGSTDKVQLRWAGDELWGKDAAGEEHRAFQRFVPSSDPGPSRVEPSTEPD